jgi:DNA-binding GntR family transcriptional regulator
MIEELDNKDKIYNELLNDIIKLKYKPGEFIKEADLSIRFNISRTPLREVIKRLALEGYIQVIPRHGNKITLIDTNSVKQMMEMRILLESKVYRNLIFKLKNEDFQEFELELIEQAKKLDIGNVDEFWEEDNHFHQRFFELDGKEIWWETIRKFEPHYMRFRKLEMTDSTNFDLLYVHHKNIVKILEERKIEDIEPILRSHIGFCLERMPILLDKYPSYFKI